MNLRDKIQALCNSTTSKEVRAICESFLQSSDSVNVAATSLFESLNGVRTADAQVNTLLNEQEDLQKGIAGIESKISKNAAQNLMENWGGTSSRKAGNVGNHVNSVMIRENAQEVKNEQLLKEGLRAISSVDASASDMLKSLESGSYGVSESIATLRGTSIAKHPQFKYILEKFNGYISSNISESKIVKDYVTSLAAYTWDKEVNDSYIKVKSMLESKAAEVEVQNAIYDIRSTDSKGFFSSIVEKMDNWVSNEKRNVPALIREMKAYQFNSIVKSLTNKLLMMENTKGTQFNIPVNSSNCEISSIYSPVIMKGGLQIFKAGPNFYAANKEGVHKMSEAQVNALPKEFLELCESFFNPSVKVVNDDIIMYVGKSKVTIGDTIKVNEQVVTASNLGNTLMTYSQGTIFGNISPLVKVAVKLAENIDNIMEIDFGKSIFSTLYEGVGVYMFRRSDKIFLNKVNPSMNENRFFEANGTQAVTFVKNFLSYNVSESLSDLLSGDVKKKVDMEKNLTVIMGNINLLESELNKIESAITANPEIADVPEIVAAKELVSSELNNARSAWQNANTELKKFENADEDKDEEPIEIVDEPEGGEGDGNGEGDGGVPATDPEPDDPATPTGDVAVPAASTEDVVSIGLAGAEGAQVQAQTIQGNDHQDAGAQAIAPPVEGEGTMVDSGFAGAEGAQTSDTAEQNLADATAIPATSTNAEITIPDNLAPNAQDAPTAPSIDPNPADAPAPTADGSAAAEPTIDAANAEGGEGVVVEPAKEEGGEEKSNEALDTSVQVKLKGSDKIGKITAADTTQHCFTVLWDDGETGDYSEDALEEIKPQSADNQAANAAAADKVTKEVAEAEQSADAPVEETPADNPEVFVKASITIDFGPYKEGEQIEINAGDYTAAGDDDPVHVKDPKEEIGTIPKKYVKVAEEAPKHEMNEIQAKLEDAIKTIEEVGTIVKGNDKIDNKSIEEALEKLKAYTGALSNQK